MIVPEERKTKGAFFSVDEMLAVFPRLKRLEGSLSWDEPAVLIRMEKILYECLSVEEMEQGLKQEGVC